MSSPITPLLLLALSAAPATASLRAPAPVTVRQHALNLIGQLPRLETQACETAHPTRRNEFMAGLERLTTTAIAEAVSAFKLGMQRLDRCCRKAQPLPPSMTR